MGNRAVDDFRWWRIYKIIKTMDIKTLKDLIKEIDFKNTSVVKMLKDNN